MPCSPAAARDGIRLTRWTAKPLFIVPLILAACRLTAGEVPGTVIDHSPASSGIYIGSPSLAILPTGPYIASHDEFGPSSTEFTRGVTRVFGSQDRGQSWRPIATLQGAFWSTLFVHRDALYLLELTGTMGMW